MAEPKPKIKTIEQLEKELLAVPSSDRVRKDQRKVLDKINKRKKQKLT